jgi:hypothetical protein
MAISLGILLIQARPQAQSPGRDPITLGRRAAAVVCSSHRLSLFIFSLAPRSPSARPPDFFCQIAFTSGTNNP